MAVARRVPVEHRFLGLDRRTFPFALVALAVWALWTVVVPWVDRQVGWNDPIRAGDVLQVTDNVTLTPIAGWGLESGLRTTDRTSSGARSSGNVLLVNDGVQFAITTGPWKGSPAALLRQITKVTTTTSGDETLHFTAATRSIQTEAGDAGVLEAFASSRVSGLIAAFVYDGQGLEIQAVGPPEQLNGNVRDISTMIESLRRTP